LRVEDHPSAEEAAPLELREDGVVGILDVTVVLANHPGKTAVQVVVQVLYVLLQVARIYGARTQGVEGVDPVVRGHRLPKALTLDGIPVAGNLDRDLHVAFCQPERNGQVVVVDQVVMAVVSDDDGNGALQQIVG